MMERNILRLLHISFTDGFYQLFMLTDQKISCLLLLQILYTIAIHLLTEIIQDLVQTLIIRSLVYDLVESHISFRQTDQISLCFCFFKFLGCHPEPSQLLLCDQLARFFYGNIFEGDTHLQNIVQILLCDAGYLCTSAWDHHYKTFLLQLTHSLTHRCSAHTKTLCKGDFQKSFARLQLSLQDRLPQGIKNNIPKRQIFIHIHRKITCHL